VQLYAFEILLDSEDLALIDAQRSSSTRSNRARSAPTYSKQQLIERLEENPGQQEREEIQSLCEKINTALDLGLAERQHSQKAPPMIPLHFAGEADIRERPATRSLFEQRVGLAVEPP
jgi:hypothetical protein